MGNLRSVQTGFTKDWTRDRRLADNLGWLRRFALTLLKQHTGRQSIGMKRRCSGWSTDFLMQVLTGKTTYTLRGEE
jgi:hypothetical protein